MYVLYIFLDCRDLEGGILIFFETPKFYGAGRRVYEYSTPSRGVFVPNNHLPEFCVHVFIVYLKFRNFFIKYSNCCASHHIT